MYESILKTATNNSDFSLSVETVPFPIIDLLEQHSDESNSFSIVFIVSIALALIPTGIVSYIVREKTDGTKHMQMVSGMALPSYWVSNYLIDMIKVWASCFAIWLIMIIFGF